jgi:hypothetical protein
VLPLIGAVKSPCRHGRIAHLPEHPGLGAPRVVERAHQAESPVLLIDEQAQAGVGARIDFIRLRTEEAG